MGAQVYEFWGRGPHGGQVMGHLVTIGAHSPHGRGMPPSLRPIRPTESSQGRSWSSLDSRLVYQDGTPDAEGNPLIGMIFFPTADATIDNASDRRALDGLIGDILGYLRLTGTKSVKLEFIGHADARGAAAFNEKLALKRAQQVATYVEGGIRRYSGEDLVLNMVRYSAKVTSMGETGASGHQRFDRRVDIVLRSTVATQQQDFSGEPTMFTLEYAGPLTRKLQFKGWGGVSFGIKLLGVEGQELEIRNPAMGKSAFYSYLGGNVGVALPIPIPVGVSPADSSYTDVEIPAAFGYVDIEDFAGPGGCISVNGVKSGSTLIFEAPKLHHSKKILRQQGWEVFMDGWAIAVPGASAGVGRWIRMPYSSAEERARYKAAHADELRNRLDRHR